MMMNDPSTAVTSATDLPDGTVLGQVDASTRENKKNKTKLALVASDVTEKSPRYRHLKALRGFENARPLTDKQVARFERMLRPDDLALAHDDHLLGYRRDVIEAAFRVSFKLEPGAENPFLTVKPKTTFAEATHDQRPLTKALKYFSGRTSLFEHAPGPADPKAHAGADIILHPSMIHGAFLRISQMQPSPDIRLCAISIVQDNLDRFGAINELWTGCGFGVIKFGDQDAVYLRPALIEDTPTYPEDHFDELMRGLRQHIDLPSQQAAKFNAYLESLWAERTV